VTWNEQGGPEPDGESHPLEVTEMSASALLASAADALTRFGWVQGMMGTVHTGFCLLGAVDYAYQSRPWHVGCSSGTFMAARDALSVLVWPLGAVHWNDAPGRTEEEVICLVRRAAAALESSSVQEEPEA